MKHSVLTLLLVLLTGSCQTGPEKRTTNFNLQVARPAAASVSERIVSSNIEADLELVDIVPQSSSSETNQDSEPNISVNPRDSTQIVASAFTPGPFSTNATFCPANLSPLYVSSDTGSNWALACVIPTFPSTFDITLRHGPVSGNLYAGILLNNSSNLQILRTSDSSFATPLVPLVARSPFDQPYIQVANLAGNETVFVGENNCCGPRPPLGGRSASIDVAFSANSPTPLFNRAVIEQRETEGFDLPSVRIAVHESDQRVFGTFFGQQPTSTGDREGFTDGDDDTHNDVTVVRDDSGAKNPHRLFADLVDPSDHKPGRIVAGMLTVREVQLGHQRLSSQISIAVDPRSIDLYPLYLAWVDSQNSGSATCTLHLKHSTDKGATWSAKDDLSIQNATNPALAVNSEGIVGFLYQVFSSTNRWETHFEVSGDMGQSWKPFVLTSAPLNQATFQFDPFLGDYIHLLAVGQTFYGIFSGDNTPDPANFPFLSTFPKGLLYLRDADFTTKTLVDKANGTTSVAPSIDPFFLRVTLKTSPHL